MDAGGLAKPGTQARATGNAYELASADTRAGPPYAYESPPAPSTAALPGAGGQVTMDGVAPASGAGNAASPYESDNPSAADHDHTAG